MEGMVKPPADNGFFNLYRGKRVLVTGDSGFKGSWISLWLNELGADVVGLSLPPKREEDHFNRIQLQKTIHHVVGDIRDPAPLEKVFSDFQPQILFHLAAQALVKKSYDDPKTTFDTNVIGSVNVLEAVRKTASLKSMVYVTSDKCYKNKEWNWGYRENDELGGYDPYSASKAAAELVFSSYLDSFFKMRDGFGAASVRAGNVVGGGDWSTDRIVPDCIRALQANHPIVLRNPNATRPWQHVLEPLSGYLKLGARLYEDPLKYSGSYNFGPRIESIRPVEELSATIIKNWGGGELQIRKEKNAPHEANLLTLNCDQANQMLKWYSKWDFERVIKETVDWYRTVFADGSRAQSISRQQITKYMEE